MVLFFNVMKLSQINTLKINHKIEVLKLNQKISVHTYYFQTILLDFAFVIF